MILSVDFVSRSEAELLTPSAEMAVISITSPLGFPPALNGYYQILRLKFQDVQQAGALWAFNPSHSSAIIAFVRELHASPKAIDLVVHCKAGVSRSAAVALYVAENIGCEFARRDLAGGAN